MATRVPRKTSDLNDGPTDAPGDGNVLAYDAAGGRYQPRAFAGADKSYVHDQAVAAAVWTVNHNLGKYPTVAVVDTAGTTAIGVVSYASANTLTITFSTAFSGKAFCN